jgi:dienelactone hydrolase
MTNRSQYTVAAIAAACAVAACAQSLKLSPDDSNTVLSQQAIAAPNPGQTGPYRVKYLTYGSGTDQRRAAYRDSVTVRTRAVDASPFVKMPPAEAKRRRKTWGFDIKHSPLNGRVWYPDGPGPFPLVVIAHGNHNPTDYSDPGYRYLGELLASRGFILVSIDENYINGSLRGENDGRAWIMLQHLKAWKAFTDSSSNPFYHRVDWNEIAIMGHSRGGGAVSHAVQFNRLSRYPDDANVTFDFHFNIRSVVAIAPVDGQYKPAGEFEPIENVNFLVMHGSHDGDVSEFMGLRPYERLKFTDGQPHFKSAWYVYRANHGQWNTIWNNHDNGPRSANRLDLRALLPSAEQRQFARVVIGGFLEATLHHRAEYLPMFRDQRTIGHWLPKTMYITRFQENSFRLLANYDEDVDVTTGSAAGVTISGDSLAVWNEAPIPLRYKNDEQNTNAVWLGWNNRIAGADTAARGAPASYTFTLRDSLVAALHVGDTSSVMLSLAPTRDMPGPRHPAKDSSGKAPHTNAGGRERPTPPKVHDDSVPMDLTVELVDADGHHARLPLSLFAPVRRPLETHPLRRADREKSAFRNPYELVLQSYPMPMAAFRKAAPAFEPARLRVIRLLFDRTPSGTVVMDDVGLANPDPAFRAPEH